MRKLILSLHISLDGFVAGPKGEIDWVKVDDEIFELVGELTDEADTALYGRVTYKIMNDYWPTAANREDASKHEIEHSDWYNRVNKIVLSRTLQPGKSKRTQILHDNLYDIITGIKTQPGKNIIIFGSPTAARSLMELNLIDEFWLFVNPILLGEGLNLFTNLKSRVNLILQETYSFSCGVTGLNYLVRRDDMEDFPMTG